MLRRTLTILVLSMLHAGCSTCSIWDECEPGDVRSCDYPGCGTCHVARQVCQDNHQWGHCVCISSGDDSFTYDPYDPYDDLFHEPDLEDEMVLDAEVPEVGDVSDDESSEPPEDGDEPDADDPVTGEDDAPDDGGES